MLNNKHPNKILQDKIQKDRPWANANINPNPTVAHRPPRPCRHNGMRRPLLTLASRSCPKVPNPNLPNAIRANNRPNHLASGQASPVLRPHPWAHSPDPLNQTDLTDPLIKLQQAKGPQHNRGQSAGCLERVTQGQAGVVKATRGWG